MLEEKIEWLIELYAIRPPIAEVFEVMGECYLYDIGVNKLLRCNMEQYMIIKSIVDGNAKNLLSLQSLYQNEKVFYESVEDIIALIKTEGLFKIRKIN